MDNKSSLCIKPLIIKKGNIVILNHGLKNERTFASEDLVKEDVLYDTTDMYFLKGEYQRLLLVNRFNIVSKQSRAVAKYFTKDGTVTEKTSDRVTDVIGQEQFKTIFTALCSILDQELKIRSILALLTLKAADIKAIEPIDIKTEDNKPPIKIFMENSCQTDEMRIVKALQKRRNRKPISPYIVPDSNIAERRKLENKKYYLVSESNTITERKPKRIIVNVKKANHTTQDTSEKVALQSETSKAAYNDEENSGHSPLSTQKNNLASLTVLDRQDEASNTKLTNINQEECNPTAILTDLDSQSQVLTDLNLQKCNSEGSLADLGYLDDEFSNDSSGKLSVLSNTPTNPELLTNPETLISNIDQHTRDLIGQTGFVVPGTDIIVPYKPEDMFHIATKDNLKYLDISTRKKLLQHQLSIDYENCLTVLDDNGNLPIHLAVRTNDAELLVRQCIVLKMRGYSVDVPDNGPTALKLAVESSRSSLVACLLRHGACPLRTDEVHRACLHDAAEKDADVLATVLTVCEENARKILYENEDLWKPEMEKHTDEQLAKYLLGHMCSMYNKQGYNPLMVASMLGLYENVRLLIEHTPNVNEKNPTCGNTALYLAIAAAHSYSIELGNKSKVVDHIQKTVELLMQHGADPSIDNSNGTNVHSLLTEFNNAELSMVVANSRYKQLTKRNNSVHIERDIAKVMLVLGREGDIQCTTIENERNKKKTVKSVNVNNVKPVDVKKDTDKKLVIVEDVILKPGNTKSAEKPKIDSKNKSKIKVFQISNKIPKGVSSDKIVITPNASKNQGIKRKQSATPNVIKQAKIDK